MNKKGIIFTIDGIIALLIISMFCVVFQNSSQYKINNVTEFTMSEKIHDLLITAQVLNINNVNELNNNYIKLFGEKKGYLKINEKVKNINYKYNNLKKKLISNSITYINASGNKVYIEIGVYY